MSIALFWAVAAVGLVVVELFTMEFTCLSIAIGCGLGGVAASLGLGPAFQIGAAVAGTVMGLGLMAPALRRRIAPKSVATGVDALPGSEAEVVEAINPPHQGKVKLHGVIWQAEAGQVIPSGTTVVVTAVEGASLRVLAPGALLNDQPLRGAQSERDLQDH